MLIYQKLKRSEVITEPFPHLVIEEALNAETIKRISGSIPKLEKLTMGNKYGNNERFNYGAS